MGIERVQGRNKEKLLRRKPSMRDMLEDCAAHRTVAFLERKKACLHHTSEIDECGAQRV
jgi:hypothetical protein